MTPLVEGDASQGHLSDIAIMNLVEQNGAEATIRLTADPNYRLDACAYLAREKRGVELQEVISTFPLFKCFSLPRLAALQR